MAKDRKGESAPREEQTSSGQHGGNRAGGEKDEDKTERSSQAAGKDPNRGKGKS